MAATRFVVAGVADKVPSKHSITRRENNPAIASAAETMPATGLVEAQVSGSSDKVYLHREAIVTNADVVRATVVPGITSVNFNVAVTFNSAGAAKMAKATAAHLNKPVAILINGRVVAAPIVRAQVGDQAVISGDFDRDQASAIAAGLNRR